MKVYKYKASSVFLLEKGTTYIYVAKSIYPEYGSIYIECRDSFFDFSNAEESNPLTFLLALGKTPEQVVRAAGGHEGVWIL